MAEEQPRGPAVPRNEDLLRALVHPDWWEPTEKKVSSAAFGFPKFSVDIESMTSLDAALSQFSPGSGMVRLQCGDAVDLGFQVCHEPENGNEAHAHVYADFGSSQRKKKARLLAEKCAVLIEPKVELLRG